MYYGITKKEPKIDSKCIFDHYKFPYLNSYSGYGAQKSPTYKYYSNYFWIPKGDQRYLIVSIPYFYFQKF